MIDLIWLVPLLPLIGFLIIGLGRNRLPHAFIGILGSGVVIISFLLSCILFADVYQARQLGETASFTVSIFDWIQVGSLNIGLSFLVDPLSSIMLLIVTGIGALIHIYSIGYMKKDPGFGKFFSFLNLFIFFMLLLVLGSNYW
jgi:NADH-quinone oxidoreductase subunit L